MRRGAEQGINENGKEGSVKSVDGRNADQQTVGDALWHVQNRDGDAGNKVHHQITLVVVRSKFVEQRKDSVHLFLERKVLGVLSSAGTDPAHQLATVELVTSNVKVGPRDLFRFFVVQRYVLVNRVGRCVDHGHSAAVRTSAGARVHVRFGHAELIKVQATEASVLIRIRIERCVRCKLKTIADGQTRFVRQLERRIRVRVLASVERAQRWKVHCRHVVQRQSALRRYAGTAGRRQSAYSFGTAAWAGTVVDGIGSTR